MGSSIYIGKYGRWVSLFVSLTLFMCLSCHRKTETSETILLRYGDKVLSYDSVVSLIPVGILPEDSAVLFDALVQGWLKDIVISEFAEQRLLDLNAIERRVKDYRNSLIVQEYLTRMRETRKPDINESQIREYYDKHRQELRLETPLVRGIFLKINSEITKKDNIKKLMSSSDMDAIDRLEQEWMDKALQYNYFRDKWIDWETLSGMIPYRFGDPDKFLGENKYFETDYDDCSYFLQISDYLPSGELQPYEFASSWIADVLTQSDLAAYEKSLLESIVEKSIKDKKLEIIGYDPIKHEMKENNVNNEE